MACPPTATCPIISSSLVTKSAFKSKETRENGSESESERNSQHIAKSTGNANAELQQTGKVKELFQDYGHGRSPESITVGGAYAPMSGYFLPSNLLEDQNGPRTPKIIAEGLAVPAGKVKGDDSEPVSSAMVTSRMKLNQVLGNRRKVGCAASLPAGTAAHPVEHGPLAGRSSGVGVSFGAEGDPAFEGSYEDDYDDACANHAASDGDREDKEALKNGGKTDNTGESEYPRFSQVDYFTQHQSLQIRTTGLPKRPRYSAATVGFPCPVTVWAFIDRGDPKHGMPTAADLPWEIRTLHETNELNTIAAYLASMRRNLKDLDVNFTFHYRPVSFIDKADRVKKIGGYSSSDKQNAHTVADLYMHTKDDRSWGTLCVTREHHVQGMAWHYWAVAAISPPKSPFQSVDEKGVYLLMYDSRPLKEPTKKRDRDYWRNYMRRDQYKLLVEIGKNFKVLDLAINRRQLSVEGEDDPLRLTLWWLWNIARYGGGFYERDGELDDPRWRLTDARWLHFDQDWSSNVRTALRWKNVKEWFSEQRLDEQLTHEQRIQAHAVAA
ncbi:hypothetical protein CBS115989_6752 [Aspergillus niger]|uniref:Uncharacterized protein n=3 Tax=Aspergillus niger TaxID=5061 RepID=A2R3X9_ASPNC|nr:hypothetical protein An14g05860 [Aspergillus niger]RDH25599.1 hypothetical protein M747DRAFT_365880 [Aspergillus niger ATCC 13496]KAI2816507.1 hypothetical protein CBS115989_6752 [Aspergillus niger]KAI2856834.1 hypothetical protein CBS11232_3550 [Aspergillus niger]KAI2877510.1 hypothetical protein CBS115988_3946 [Aspergillus niger]CAK42147.1 hypothetical protein An14g05860 [Aspergillus niger]